MKKIRISYIERKFHYFVSVEKVFRQIEGGLNSEKFIASFVQLPFLNTLAGMIKNLISFRYDKNADVFHVTGDCHYIALILPRERTVLTIHDLRFLHTRTGLRRAVLKKIQLDLPLKRLKYVTAVSAATKDEIVGRTRCDPAKIRVIENPLDEGFVTDGKPEFNTACPNILQIGTSPNKNVANLIRAIEGLNCRLTLIGELNNELKHLLHEKNIQFEARSELDDAAIKAEYHTADMVVFCSIYEGFGLPVIEAQAMQTPVVTSNISPLKEVAGDGGAVLVDPRNHGSIREGIMKVIEDRDLREALRENGRKNIKRFDRGTIAAKYESLYNEIFSDPMNAE